jgi:integrase
MTQLQVALQQYLELRRKLGFQLRGAEAVLGKFVAFVSQEGGSSITTDLAMRWLGQPSRAQACTKAMRLGMIRGFASWLSASDPQTEVPAQGLIPHRTRRQQPYIYSDHEVQRLVSAAENLSSPGGMRGPTHSTCFGLLAATGMRISEAVGLDNDDVDLELGVLTIRLTKFGKSRLVPLHPTTTEALRSYRDRRDVILGQVKTPAFFVTDCGARLAQCGARYNFALVSRQVGLRKQSGRSRHGHGHGPRVHDLRHRFAVKTLLDWYRQGLDVERELPKLATYLGHTHIHDTYWYLEAVPELLRLATDRVTAQEGEGKS